MHFQLLLLMVTGFFSWDLALAESFSKVCPEIVACTKFVSQKLGQKYVFSPEVKGQVQASGSLTIDQENAEELLTLMLYTNGFSRVPMGGAGTFQIVPMKEARDLNLPIIRADAQSPPRFQQNWDLVTMQYKAKYPAVIDHISRTIRAFMPAGARVVAEEVSGSILITDSWVNLKKTYTLIQDMDQKPSPELLKKWEEIAQQRKN